ncbi:SDR family oxidoreductase [Zavarzinia compransoris]|uniref:SDR family NAD(P)-dependent oxidoreductase n=1 Tax=Zavarzinia marina TaxID=2911065 RepID=UPI001F1C4C8A|nr:SDR family oxidoreductase [Zavarzinia marina]MCF4166681.1 SDR family oxidoreductase [Zavarzinia marina]
MGDGHFPEGVALIVGGSGGIGRAVAKCFAEAGCDIAVTYRRKAEVAAEVAAEADAMGRKGSSHAVDLTDADSVGAMVAGVAAEHGRIHTVVFAAGPVVEQMPIADVTPDLWRRSIETETFGFFNVVSAVVPHMRAAGGGSFVHLGSAGHMRWPIKDGLSVAPKAANEALIKGIAREEGRNGIRANSVLIGVIEAGMFLELKARGVFDDHWIKETLKMLSIKRLGRPEEIGHAAVFLASDRAAYVTGQTINVSGGFGL